MYLETMTAQRVLVWELWMLLVTTSFVAASSDGLVDDLSHFMSRSTQYGQSMQDASSILPQCKWEINRLMFGNRETLTKDMIMALDAFGKPGAGFLQGNWAWLGHYDECMEIEGFNYCLVTMYLNASKFGDDELLQMLSAKIRWGTCVPTNCSESDVHVLMTYLLASPNLLGGHVPPGALVESGVKCAKDPPIPYSAGVICTIILCCLLASLMILGALYDEYLKLRARNVLKRHLNGDTVRSWSLMDETEQAEEAGECQPLMKDVKPGTTGNKESWPTEEKQGLAARFLLAFAVNRNLVKLMDVKQSDSSISSLNGIRVFSMLWVILGHTVFFGFYADITDNRSVLFKWTQNHPGFQLIMNAFLSVDSFFFLSGFLLAYLTFSRFRQLRSGKAWALFYFHRYWRLTPLYAFFILFFMYIPQFVGYGPMWQDSVRRTSCEKYWWTNLLYINNFVPSSFIEGCVGWGWYLANDMQFFIISPLLMAPLFYYPVFGWVVLLCTLLASLITTGFIIGVNDLNVNVRGYIENLDGSGFASIAYAKPYCRIAPYLVGIGLAYIMHRIGRRQFKMSLILTVAGWLLAGGMAAGVVFSLYPSYTTPMTKAGNIVYGSISRFIWAVALAWVVFACKYKYGGWINSLLSWSAWVPLARVTYSAYLFHPVVMIVFFYNFGTTWHFSVYLTAFYFTSLVLMTYCLAILATLAIEYPFANLEKIILPTRPEYKKLAEGKDPEAAFVK